jgi:hypothetical protein
MNTKLINFRSPEDLQTTFDLVCRYKSQSRTQVLITLMREFISTNHKPIINDIQSLQDLNKNLSEFVLNDTGYRHGQNLKQTDSEMDLWVSDEDEFQHQFHGGNIT